MFRSIKKTTQSKKKQYFNTKTFSAMEFKSFINKSDLFILTYVITYSPSVINVL